MKRAVRIEFDHVRVRTRRALPPQWRGYVRRAQRNARRIRASGILVGVANTGVQLIRIYTTGTSATETIPAGYNNSGIECWGGGGGGGAGSTGSGAGGGGGGAFARSSLVVSAKAGLTFTYTVGPGGNGTGGTASSINAGTVTGWTNITCLGGNIGSNGPTGAGGTGGSASGGTISNTTGPTGAAGTGAAGGAGTGTAGALPGDGGPYGVGGHGGFDVGNTGRTAGTSGACVFIYTA